MRLVDSEKRACCPQCKGPILAVERRLLMGPVQGSPTRIVVETQPVIVCKDCDLLWTGRMIDGTRMVFDLAEVSDDQAHGEEAEVAAG